MFNAPVIHKASFIRVPWWKTWYRSHSYSSLIRFPLRFESIGYEWPGLYLLIQYRCKVVDGQTMSNPPSITGWFPSFFPSTGGFPRCWLTGTDATEAAEYFATLLLLLGKLRCTVSVVAHSLGCRVALTALTALTAKPGASGASGDVPQEHVQVQQLGVKKNVNWALPVSAVGHFVTALDCFV